MTHKRISQEVAREFDKIVITKPKFFRSTLFCQLDQLEHDLISRYGPDRFIVNEIKRRILECKLSIGLDSNCSFEFVKGVYRDLRRSGFSNFERELHCKLLYARANANSGRSGIAKSMINRLYKKLEDSKHQYNTAFVNHWVDSLQKELTTL